MSVSAVVLNFNRPEYIRDYIQWSLLKDPNVNEIVISNGKEETDLSLEKQISLEGSHFIKNLQHWGKPNEEYGLTLRFLSALEAKNEYVLIMDDDIIPEKETVQFLLDRVKEEPDIIHGFYGRSLPGMEYSYENVFGEVPIVLTRCLMTTKTKCQFFIDNFRFYENDRIKASKPYWNGEDILFSLMSVQNTGKMNKAYDLPHTNRVWNYLNLSESISVGGGHDEYRKKLSKELVETMALKDVIKKGEKVDKSKYQLTYFVQNSYIPRYLMTGFCGRLF